MLIPNLTPQPHHRSLTLCDAEFAYYEHDAHLVRQRRQPPGEVQGYRGEGQWVDLPARWADEADFLRPGGPTLALTQGWQIELLMIEKDSRGD